MRPKDIACCSLLLKLEARGWIRLPPRQRASVNGRRNLRSVEVDLDRSVLEADLASLQPLRLDLVGPGSPEAALFRGFPQHRHYLGLRNCVGENLGYSVWSRTGRPVAALLFGATAWHCQRRDAFIGWNEQQRHQHRSRLTNNTRFLIPPWVRVPHLASHVLARVIDRHPLFDRVMDVVREAGMLQDFRGSTTPRSSRWTAPGTTLRRRSMERVARTAPPRRDREFTFTPP